MRIIILMYYKGPHINTDLVMAWFLSDKTEEVVGFWTNSNKLWDDKMCIIVLTIIIINRAFGTAT